MNLNKLKEKLNKQKEELKSKEDKLGKGIIKVSKLYDYNESNKLIQNDLLNYKKNDTIDDKLYEILNNQEKLKQELHIKKLTSKNDNINTNKNIKIEWKNSFDAVKLYNELINQILIEKELKMREDNGEIVNKTTDKDLKNNNIKEFDYIISNNQTNLNYKRKSHEDNNIDNLTINNINSIDKLNAISDIDFEYKCNELYIWINYSFTQWKKYIIEKNKEEINKLEARKRIGLYLQSKKYFKFFYNLLMEKKAPTQVVNKLFESMIFCINKDYIKAYKRYYEVAIGTAPWPKGYKKFSIHQKFSERIRKESDIAYVMNDDTTKKYLLAFKRLLTMYQNINPTKPSLMISS